MVGLLILKQLEDFSDERITPYNEPHNVAKASNKILASVAKYIHTITADNGSEFAAYEEIENKLGIDFYFCDPYSSWQR